MATSAQPESGREAPDASAAAAREASAPAVITAPPGTINENPGTPAGTPAAPVPARNEGETVDQYKVRIAADARARATALASGQKPLTPAEIAAKVEDIHDPVKAAQKAAKAATEAAAQAGEGESVESGEATEVAETESTESTETAEVAAEGAEAAAAETEQKPETDEAEVAPAGISLEIPVPGQETPFLMEVGDQETADILTDLKNRAVRGDQARAIRDEAVQIRDETEDERDRFNMVVDLDPAGVIQETVTDPRDQVHLAKFLLTRPGVLEHLKDWFAAAVEDTPEEATKRAELLELERYKRRDAVKDAVQKEFGARVEGRKERRQVAQGIHQAIVAQAPESFTKESLDALYEDVAADVEVVRRNSPSKRIDGRNIPAIVTRRLKLYGHAPRGEKAAAPAAASTARPSAPPAKTTAAVPAKPAADTKVTPKTAKSLRDASRARQDASTASPGAGAQVSRTPTPPPFDPKLKGSAVEQRIAWARKTFVPSMQKRPV